VLTEGF